jgi:hypothetical protein
MKQKFNIQVVRYYIVRDIIEVETITEEEAIELAKEISDNKDYTDQYFLDEVIGFNSEEPK